MGRGSPTVCAETGANVTIFDVDTDAASETVAQVEAAGRAAVVVEQGDGTVAELREMVLGDQLIERMGTGVEIGPVLALVLSDHGVWITGASIAVDGGKTVLP